MSAAARSSRARRGQVMIIGHGINPPAGCRWPRDPKLVENFFDALGELTVATAAQPISTVVVGSTLLRELDGEAQLAVDALRRIDPAVRVVLIESQHNGRATAPLEGIDDILAAPLSAQAIAELFDEDVSQVEAPQSTTHVTKPAKTPATIPSAPKPAAPAIKAPAPIPSPQIAIPKPSTTVVPPAPQDFKPSSLQASPQPLGDTDLVDAILTSPHGIESLALQLIIQQTGWNDLQLITDPAAARGFAQSTEVTHAGQSFGHLVSNLATTKQLQPWADWLARWIALDRSHREHRLMAYRDELTGAWNRRFFNTFLADAIARGAQQRRPVTVMVFDIDNFKSYNDDFGHESGDDILRETVRLMNAVIRQGDRVCRIGGDEFAVIFADPEGPRQPGSTHPDSVEVIAKRFQDKVCSMSFPKLGVEAPGTLSISAGLATYPWDGSTPESLLRHADQFALESKRKGKNAITFGPGAQRECGNKE